MVSLVFVLICLYLSSIRISLAQNSSAYVSNEERLRRNLFATFDTRIRPNASSELLIEFVLMSLNDLRIEQQEMSIMVIFQTTWYDERLKWNSSEYDGLTGIVVSLNEMWAPNFIVQNAVSSIKALGDKNVPFRLWSTGRVMWAPPVHLDTSCEMQVLYFPFEEQECSIIIYPYAYLAREIELKIRTDGVPVNLQYYGENAAWQFVASSYGNTSLRDNDDEYPALIYTLKFKRRWLFMALSLILPSVLNLILMLGVFTLHIESGEKMGYSLTVLLSYIVLMTLVGDMLPQVSTQVSLLQIYLAFVLVVGCLSTLITIWIINIYNRDDDRNPIPKTTKTILKWIVLPITSKLFWSYFVWRYIKRHHTSVDDKSDISEMTEKSCLGDNSSSSIPPKSTYTPCSVRQIQVANTPQFRQILGEHDIKYEHLSSFPSTDGDTSDTSSVHLSKSGGMPPVFSTTDSERELSLYCCSTPSPPPPISPPNTDTFPSVPPNSAANSNHATHQIDVFLDRISWKDMAMMLDSFCLRCLGGPLLVLTLVMLFILFLRY